MKERHKPKIGFLVGEVHFGGGERILNMLISHFHEKKYDITIFSWNKDWEKFNNLYEIILLNNYPKGGVGKFYSYRELKNILSTSKIDTLIVFNIGFAEVALWSAKAANIPIILSERVDPNFSPKSKLRRFYKKILFKYADGVVFQTNEVQNFYKNFVRNNSIVIHNPIIDDNLPDISNIRRKEIVVIARLSKEKRIETIIECFTKIKNKDYKLIIYGEGPEKDNLNLLITKFGLRERIILKGKVNNIVEAINGSDIFVMYSEMEGMPNALIESMAMGLSCISTNFPSGGAKALINDGFNGILIDVNNKQHLIDALNRLIYDQVLNDSLKLNALNIRETHNKDIIMPKWENFIFSKLKP